MSENVRFHKILALAVNPAAQEGEAQAAFGKLRQLVRLNPHLAAPPSFPPMPPPVAPKAEECTVKWRLTQIAPRWFSLVIDNLSSQAYSFGLRSRFACDFTETPTPVDITCTGPKDACDHFSFCLNVLIEFINSQPPTPQNS
jgi:hypothetical protein